MSKIDDARAKGPTAEQLAARAGLADIPFVEVPSDPRLDDLAMAASRIAELEAENFRLWHRAEAATAAAQAQSARADLAEERLAKYRLERSWIWRLLHR